jgi:hypothetical protein
VPLRRAYRLSGRPVLADITRLGLGTAFGALWGELQFAPKDAALGVKVLRGLTEKSVEPGHMVRLGPVLLYYFVDDNFHVVYLLDLIPIL